MLIGLAVYLTIGVAMLLYDLRYDQAWWSHKSHTPVSLGTVSLGVIVLGPVLIVVIAPLFFLGRLVRRIGGSDVLDD